VDGYSRLLTRYVYSNKIGSVPLSRLTTLALEGLYAELCARPLAPRTVRLLHSVLHVALAKAARDRLLTANPASGATRPRHQRREMRALDRIQLSRLLATSEATGNRWQALWHLLATGGLRPSEALRLTWEDVGPNYVIVRGETKTEGSRRTVSLPAATIQALAWHHTLQEAEKIAAGTAYKDAGRVFATQTGGQLDLKNATARHFKPLFTAYYLLPDIRLYDLRHTHASLLLAAGTPVHVVARRLGHASPMMTLNVYAHVLNGQSEDVLTRLEGYMNTGQC
jgi:integrase